MNESVWSAAVDYNWVPLVYTFVRPSYDNCISNLYKNKWVTAAFLSGPIELKFAAWLVRTTRATFSTNQIQNCRQIVNWSLSSSTSPPHLLHAFLLPLPSPSPSCHAAGLFYFIFPLANSDVQLRFVWLLWLLWLLLSKPKTSLN